jgi:hypothetical protein
MCSGTATGSFMACGCGIEQSMRQTSGVVGFIELLLERLQCRDPSSHGAVPASNFRLQCADVCTNIRESQRGSSHEQRIGPLPHSATVGAPW